MAATRPTPTPTPTPTPAVGRPAPPAAAAAPAIALFSAEAHDRSIPVRTGDLARLLMAEPDLAPADVAGLGQFVRLLGSVLHYEYYGWLNELKELYAPIDPDSDCVTVAGCTRPHTLEDDEAFLGPFETSLVRANYRKLEFHVLEQAIQTPNELGLNYEPDLKLFEHLRVYVRGATTITRSVRNLKSRFRKREIIFDGYRRVVIVLKFRPGSKLKDAYVNADVLYLRMFKDVPYVDMEMHLPEQGTRVKMRMMDKAQIASPLMIGIPTFALKLLGATLLPGAVGLFALPWGSLAAIMAAPFTASMNSFFGFQRAKQKHLHRMIRHLYYLTLANNGSVINRLIDSAEEEDFKEALLAYYFLWRGRDDPEPWDSARLDAAIEDYLRAKASASIDFEISDALAKLVRLGLVRRDAMDRLTAVPVNQALEVLDAQWDNYFRYPHKCAAARRFVDAPAEGGE